jgi:hypothetical protein
VRGAERAAAPYVPPKPHFLCLLLRCR